MEICGENMRKTRRNSKLCVLLGMKRTCYILQVLARFIILMRQCLAIDVVCQQVGRNGKKKATESRMFADKQKIWPKRFNHLIGTQKENFMIYVFYGNRSRCIWV